MTRCAPSRPPRRRSAVSSLGLPVLFILLSAFFGCAESRAALGQRPASARELSIAGRVYDAHGVPLPDVTIRIDELGLAVRTDASGSYLLAVPRGTAGTIRPCCEGYSFTPEAWSFRHLRRSLDNIDFRATGTTGPPAPPPAAVQKRNRPPDARDQVVETIPRERIKIQLEAADPDHDRLSFLITALPRLGTLLDATDDHLIRSAELPYALKSGAGCLYQAPERLPGAAPVQDTFGFVAFDGRVTSAEARVAVVLRPVRSPTDVSIPSADPQTVFVPAGTPKFIVLTGHDGAGYSSLEPRATPLAFALLSQPAHGTLYREPPELIYVPEPDYVGRDSFDFAVSDGVATSPPATVTLDVRPWRAPIGIPEPAFGIHDTHLMYVGASYDFGAGPEPYPDAGNGPYTHYVDNAHPNATDDDNPFGTPDRPRRSLPTVLAPGSVVEVHGGVETPYTYPSRDMWIDAQGTPDQPIFIRGVPDAEGNLPRFDRYLRPRGRYVVVETLMLDGRTSGEGIFRVIDPADHIVLRHCELVGGQASGVQLVAKYNAGAVSDVVIYNNKINDLGDWLADYDQDYHGVAVNVHAIECLVARLWFVDNEFYHCSGNGIQVNATSSELQPRLHHVYIGRNRFHHNKQRGVGIKQSEHVIVTQNLSYACRPVGEHPSNPGDGMGANYGPDNVWFLYNRIFDCDNGIRYSSGDQGNGSNMYLIGNLIYDIRHSDTDVTGKWPVAYDPADPWSPGKGIAIWNATGAKHVINNTLWNCDAGIYVTYNLEHPVIMANNAIGAIGDGSGETQHIRIFQTRTASVCLAFNNVLSPPARIRWGETSGGPVYDVAQLERAFPDNAWDNQEADLLCRAPDAADFRPRADSPVVDAGALYEAYKTFRELYGLDITVDAAGMARPEDGDLSGSAEFDVGALEYAPDRADASPSEVPPPDSY